jgi:menaquinone-dependent protoporphyrinogen oxidase
VKRVLVAYATREGHTGAIAAHLADALRARQLEVDVVDLASPPAAFDLGDYRFVVLAGSLHLGRHEPELVKFAKAHRDALEAMPNALLSVSLSEAGAEDPKRTPEERAKAAEDVAATIRAFCEATGWHPERTLPVAGALLFSKYNVLLRFVMRRIAKSEGQTVTTKQDYVYTNWESLDHLADDVRRALEPPPAPAVHA